MQKSDVTAFFSTELNGEDWQHLDDSRAETVMVPSNYASVDALRGFEERGVAVYLRFAEGMYDDATSVGVRCDWVAERCNLAGIIAGVEPDRVAVLSRGEPSWGQAAAYAHRLKFDAVRKEVHRRGHRVISPGFAMNVRFPDGHVARSISEDDPPAPGFTTWREICTMPDTHSEFGYSEADGNGAHVYCYDHTGVVDVVRFKMTVQKYDEAWHRDLYIDEFGVGKPGPDVPKMVFYCDLMGELIRHPTIGGNVRMAAMFLFNGDPGNPPAYPPYYVIRDPEAFRYLGRWMNVQP